VVIKIDFTGMWFPLIEIALSGACLYLTQYSRYLLKVKREIDF